MNKMQLPIATFINVLAVLIGSAIGLSFQQMMPNNIEQIVLQAIGLATILIGVKMMLKLPENYMLIFVFSLILGGIFGELIQLDKILNGLSENLKDIIGSNEINFSEGLITAFLLFCVGSMTIVGAIEEGINQNRELILVKSTLDFFSAIALASSFGIGVMFSAVPMLIFQGGLTILAVKIKKFIDDDLISLISAVGGILIIGISINILKLGVIKLENLLPSLLVVVLLAKTTRWIKNKRA